MSHHRADTETISCPPLTLLSASNLPSTFFASPQGGESKGGSCNQGVAQGCHCDTSRDQPQAYSARVRPSCSPMPVAKAAKMSCTPSSQLQWDGHFHLGRTPRGCYQRCSNIPWFQGYLCRGPVSSRQWSQAARASNNPDAAQSSQRENFTLCIGLRQDWEQLAREWRTRAAFWPRNSIQRRTFANPLLCGQAGLCR